MPNKIDGCATRTGEARCWMVPPSELTRPRQDFTADSRWVGKGSTP